VAYGVRAVTRAVVGEVDRDARRDDVPRWLARGIFWGAPLGAAVLAATFVHRPLFRWLLSEDSLLEWIQVTLMAAAAVAGVVAAYRRARRGDRFLAVLLAGFALVMLAGVGEEISWGQRILGLTTPQGLAEINHQAETNLHNIKGDAINAQLVFNWMQLIAGLVGTTLPWLTRTEPRRVGSRLLREVSPPLFTTSCFALLFGYRLVRFFVPSSVTAAVKFGEWPELAFALGLAAFAVLAARNAAATGRQAVDTPQPTPRETDSTASSTP
jgi:hypothetical protein